MSEVLADEQLRAAGIVIETGDSQGDYDLTIASPIDMVGEAKKAPQRAPDIGADSLTVLRELDFEESYLQELLSTDVIVDGSQSKGS